LSDVFGTVYWCLYFKWQINSLPHTKPQWFNIVLVNVRHWSLSLAIWMHFTLCSMHAFKIIFPHTYRSYRWYAN
jgi:hypothetical protein